MKLSVEKPARKPPRQPAALNEIMKKRKLLNKIRNQRRKRTRAGIKGNSQKPRLTIKRSNKHVFAQLIDDEKRKTIASASSYKMKGKANKSQAAKLVGLAIAEQAKKLGIKSVVFDRGAYRYHGRVKALAEGARENGLKF